MSEKNKGPWESVADAIENLFDRYALSRSRLTAVENRMAALDGGPDAEAASRLAYDDVNASRRREGRPVLGFKRP